MSPVDEDLDPKPDLSSAERRARWADAVLRDLDRIAQATTTDAWERCAHDADCACLVVPADHHKRVVMSLRADPAGKCPVASDADRTFIETFTPGRVRALVELARRLVARELIDTLREPAAEARAGASSDPAERAGALGWVPAVARVLRPRRSRPRRFAVSTWTTRRVEAALREVSDSFRQFSRNGRCGTCSGCPVDADGRKYPEFCVHTDRYDHQLTVDQLAEQFKIRVRIAAESGGVAPRGTR